MVLGPGTRRRRLPNPGAADLREMCLANPETGAVTGSPEALSEADLRTGAESTYWRAHYHAQNCDDIRATELLAVADRLEAWADVAPLEAAVLNAAKAWKSEDPSQNEEFCEKGYLHSAADDDARERLRDAVRALREAQR